MADLDLRPVDSGIYSTVEDNEALPLFVRYTNDDARFHDKNSSVSFAETISALVGVHICYIIHRQQKGKNKVYEEVAIKFDEQPYCMTAQLSRDGGNTQGSAFYNEEYGSSRGSRSVCFS